MGLDLKPRYVGPSPKKLLVGAALAFALVAGAYEVGKHASTPAAPTTTQTQTVKTPALK